MAEKVERFARKEAEVDDKLDVDLREVWLGSSLSGDEVEAAFDRPSPG